MTSSLCMGKPGTSKRTLAPIAREFCPVDLRRMATRVAGDSFLKMRTGAFKRFITMSASPSPSKSPAAIPCDMSSSTPKPQASFVFWKVPSPEFRKTIFFSGRGGNWSRVRLQSSPAVTLCVRSCASPSSQSSTVPLLVNRSSNPSRSTSRKRAPQVQPEAANPACKAISEKVPSPRFIWSVLRLTCGRILTSPGSAGASSASGTCALRSIGSGLNISATKRSGQLSRSTSATATAIEAVLVFLIAIRSIQRN